MSFERIGILGLGLMGNAIALGLKGKKETVTDDDLLDRLDEIDALILAVPISAILEIADTLAQKKLTRPLVVFDIGSVKGNIARRFEQHTGGLLEMVATHPMAAQELNDTPWVITPHTKNTKETLLAVMEIILLLGGRPLMMSAEDHDKKAALISHMPYVISKALLEFAAEEDPASLAMAGPGFHSMTRIAKTNPVLREEIARANEKNMKETLDKFIAFLGRVS